MLSHIDLLQGNLDSAVALAERALEVDTRLKDRLGCILDQEQLGRLLAIRSDTEGARKLYRAALRLSEEAGDLASVLGKRNASPTCCGGKVT